MTIWPKTWPWRISCALVLAFFAYSGSAYFGVPALLRYLTKNQAATALHRPVAVGDIKFNPYSLRLSIADLNVGGRDESPDFIKIAHVRVRLSWKSLFNFALVIKKLAIDKPVIRVERLGGSTFNFSDLLEAGSSNRARWSFALSNIEVNDGLILFNDQVLKKEHRLDNIRLSIPFIANLPTDADIYVQPMLQMRVDGSPISLTGKMKPFRGTLESVMELNLRKLDITRFAGYLADKLPFKLKQAELTAALQFHFIQIGATPQLQTAGAVTLDNVAINDRRDSPLAQMKQLQAAIAEFDPLTGNVEFSSIVIDSLTPHYVIKRDGTTNLASLFAGPWATRPTSPPTQTGKGSTIHPTQNPNIQPTAPPLLNPLATTEPSTPSGTQTASGTPEQNTANSQLRLSVASLEVENSMLDIEDDRGPTPAAVQFSGIHLGVKNLATVGGTPAPYTFRANLKSGGRLEADGTFELAASQATGKITLANIDLRALQGFAGRVTPATIASGELSGQVSGRAALGSHFSLRLEPARIALDGVELRPPNQPHSIMGWKHLVANLDHFDLASHQAVVRELRSDGLHLTALRNSQGNLNLASLLNAPAPVGEGAKHTGADYRSSGWQYRIESLIVENADAAIEDDAQQQPFSIRITPFNVSLKGLTSDFAKPFAVEFDGSMARRGTFKLAGETAINTFKSRVHVSTQHIDLVPFEPLIRSALAPNQLNAKITHALLAINGDVQAQVRDGKLDALYQGSAMLDHVRLSDKLTGVSFFRWDALNLDNLAIRYGGRKPRVQIGQIALSDFYAALILNADGRLNLRNVITRPPEGAVPVTRPTVRSSTATAPSAIPADIMVGSVALQNGETNYVDDFIKPHYSVVLNQLEGRIGGFGTSSTKPAEVLLTGKVNRTSPLSISGSINPLSPMASLDLRGDASRIQLPPLTPYAAKYTGYPITGGTLTGNVHYTLANRHLTATNHLILDQLTFGERVENSAARNLPVRLAIAVLKDSQGRIDLRIPVSGSLSDPEFDLGRILWQGIENVIMKAAAAPFTILASAAGGKKENLAYVEFAPGYSNLSQPSQAKLEKLAVLLSQRRSLKLRITGRVDPRLDLQGLREATLENEVKLAKAKNEHLPTAPGAIEQVEVTPDEYVRYLRRVYRNADFAKPRDLVGMTKSLPPDEMKKLLLANIKVTEADLRNLAEARAAAVYRVLSARIDRARLVMAAPKLNAEGITEGATTRVDFSLE